MSHLEWGVLNCYANFWGNSKFWNRNSNLLIFQQRNSKEKFQPESLESKTKLEFHFWWGSQKLEPKNGIPNQALKANHLFSSQQFLVDHLHSTDICNRMHRQQFLRVIGQGYWMFLDKALLLLAQWDSQSGLKCNPVWLMYQHLVLTHHWILQHKDLLNNNNNKPIPMLDPCKYVHEEIKQLVYQDQLFHREQIISVRKFPSLLLSNVHDVVP